MEHEVRLSRRIGDFDWHLSRGRWSSIPQRPILRPCARPQGTHTREERNGEDKALQRKGMSLRTKD